MTKPLQQLLEEGRPVDMDALSSLSPYRTEQINRLSEHLPYRSRDLRVHKSRPRLRPVQICNGRRKFSPKRAAYLSEASGEVGVLLAPLIHAKQKSCNL